MRAALVVMYVCRIYNDPPLNSRPIRLWSLSCRLVDEGEHGHAARDLLSGFAVQVSVAQEVGDLLAACKTDRK